MRLLLALAAALLAAPAPPQGPSLEGQWRAGLDLAGGVLPFELRIAPAGGALSAAICNGRDGATRALISRRGDSIVVDIADYAATITVAHRGDSLTGMYRNVGNRGPRTIPFRAARGRWPRSTAPAGLLGSWDATFNTDGRLSPRVFEFRNGAEGLEAAFLANSGDYGLFWGGADGAGFRVARFDGTFVFMLEGRLDGDTLRGTYHAGLRTQTPYTAVRSTGKPHLVAPTALTSADTVNPFRFAFPDLEGRVVTQDDPRLRGKVLMIDIFGSWCSTCHDAMPDLLDLHKRYGDRGLEIVGFGYEVSPDSGEANPLIRRFRDKFSIPWLLLRAGINVTEETAATLPQLRGFTAYPTTLFVGRDGRIRQVYAGFRGPAAGAQHAKQVEDFNRLIEALLAER
ncbi:MAG: TlpA family protein disulfide reductase [Gemmatimonadales bacterium]|nr:TlpA family protein disulfide reductase [Gemmatimonadales bacterium]